MTRSRLIGWQLEYPLADLETISRAWLEIYIAEGSDWFWWYYSHNKTGNEQVFDVDFRTHLGNVYRIMGLPVPSWLVEPIAGLVVARSRAISSNIAPRLSMDETASLEWTGAGYVEPALSSGVMQRAGSVLKRLYFGHNPADLYLRLETNEDFSSYFAACYVTRLDSERASQPRHADSTLDVRLPDLLFSFEIAAPPDSATMILSQAAGHGVWQMIRPLDRVARGPRSLEFALALSDIGLEAADTVAILVTLVRDSVVVESLPNNGYISFTIADSA